MRFLVCLLISCLLQGAAFAQNLKAADPQGIADRIRSLGYKAELKTDKSGDPVIHSAADGSQFVVTFYGCDKGKNCEWLLFYEGYTVEKADYPKVRQLADEWNLDLNFAKAAMDDGAIHLTFSLIMNNEGMPQKLFDSNFATWIQEYVEFRKKIAATFK